MNIMSEIAALNSIETITSSIISKMEEEIQVDNPKAKILPEYTWQNRSLAVSAIYKIVRGISMNWKHRDALLRITNMTNAEVSVFWKHFPTLSFVNKETNEIVHGNKGSNPETLVELIQYLGKKLGIETDKEELSQAFDPTWIEKVWENSERKAEETQQMNKENQDIQSMNIKDVL